MKRIDARNLDSITYHLDKIFGLITDELIPHKARLHFRNAEREALIGCKLWIEEAISRLDEEQNQDNECHHRKSYQEIKITDE